MSTTPPADGAADDPASGQAATQLELCPETGRVMYPTRRAALTARDLAATVAPDIAAMVYVDHCQACRRFHHRATPHPRLYTQRQTG